MKALILLAGLLLAGCSGAGMSPAWWSLADVQPGLRAESRQSPAVMVEMLVAMKVASERCAGRDAQLLRRHGAGQLAQEWQNMRNWGREMAWHYQRAYGTGWRQQVAMELQQARQKYETYPDSAFFCAEAARVVASDPALRSDDFSRLPPRPMLDELHAKLAAHAAQLAAPVSN